jgi:hypothetical protein
MAASTPPQPAGVGRHVIESIEVSGGYHHGLRAELALRLNVVIGPPGTRTSTLRKLACFSLGLPVTEVRAKEVSAHVAATLGTGRVTVRGRTRHGARNESSRACGEETRVVTGGDAAAHVSLDGVLFRADFVGPGERPRPSRSAKRVRLNDKKKVAENKKERRGREE